MENATPASSLPEPEIETPEVRQKRRADWHNNNRQIQKAIISHYKSAQVFPTQAEIAKITGFTEATVSKHFQDIDFADIFETERKRMATLSGPLFMAIFNSALKGSARAQEMLLQVVYKWAKPIHMELEDVSSDKVIAPEDLVDIDKGIEMLQQLKLRQETKVIEATPNDPSGTGTTETTQ